MAFGSALTWSLRTMPLAGPETEGATLAARKTSSLPFCVKVSLRLAVDAAASAKPASR